MPHAVQPAVGGLRFEVLAEIAVGNTARVDLCRTTAPAAGQLVAVKRLVPEIAADPVVANRFLDEVWMTSALRHTNVVGVVGWGKDEQGAYLAVELVQGVSLARLMKTVFDTREEFPERLVVYVGLCVLRGLQAAHDLVSERGEPLGLVHRDLGVQNVLVGFNGDVKIADFGLAKAKNRMTQTTSSLPTRAIGHLSPEELRGEEIDNRSDLYGVGVMLYELLTGRQPFAGKDELDTARLILNAPTPDPVRVRPRIDMALAATVRRCLEKNPAARFRSARDVARELEQWLYAHGYREDNPEALARFVRRNAMRQMRWFERVIAGEPAPQGQAPRDNDRADVGPKPHSASEAQATTGSQSRDTETTVVDAAKKPKLPPRRARSSDAVPAFRKRRDSASPEALERQANARPGSDAEEDEGEDIPTVAMKRGDHPAFRALLEGRTENPAAGADARRSTTQPLGVSSRPPAEPQRTPPRPGVAPTPRRDPPARETIPIAEMMMAEASSSDVVEITEDPSTVTPPPRQSSPPPLVRQPVGQPVGVSSHVARPQAPTAPPPLPQAHGAAPSGVPSRSAPPPPSRQGFGARAPLQPRPTPPPTMVIESPTTFDPSRTHGALAEATEQLSTHTLAPEYIQLQVERLRDDAAQKNAEARRLRELAQLASRDAERAELAARKAEHAASLAVDAIRIAAVEGMGAAAAKLEEALAVAER